MMGAPGRGLRVNPQLCLTGSHCLSLLMCVVQMVSAPPMPAGMWLRRKVPPIFLHLMKCPGTSNKAYYYNARVEIIAVIPKVEYSRVFSLLAWSDFKLCENTASQAENLQTKVVSLGAFNFVRHIGGQKSQRIYYLKWQWKCLFWEVPFPPLEKEKKRKIPVSRNTQKASAVWSAATVFLPTLLHLHVLSLCTEHLWMLGVI